MARSAKIYKVVGVYDLAPIDAGETSESFKFRIEVLTDLSKRPRFHAKVYRSETLRVRPTFPIAGRRLRGFLADYEMLVADDAIGGISFKASSPALVVRKVRKRIAEVFGNKSKRPGLNKR